jgi:hypothetical protein
LRNIIGDELTTGVLLAATYADLASKSSWETSSNPS